MSLTSILVAGLGLCAQVEVAPAPPAPESGGAWVELVGGERLAGRLEAIVDGVARVALADAPVPGTTRSVPLSELVLARAAAPPGPAPALGRDVVWLAGPSGSPGPGHDRLAGRLAGGDEYGLVLELQPALGLSLPFEVIERVLPLVDRPLDLLAALEGGGFDDRVWRRRDDGGLDGVSGVLLRFQPGQLVLESSLGDLPFALEELLALVLADTAADDRPLSGWPCRVALAGGSVFDAGLVELADGVLALDTSFAGRLQLPADLLQTLLPGPHAERFPRRLSALAPVEVAEWTGFAAGEDVLYPWRVELGVAGGPLALGGVLAASGLGVHAHSRLVFEVPPGADSFRVTVGLTDDVLALPATGSVGFRLALADAGGEPLASAVVREGDAPAVLRLDGLRPGGRLELSVDAGGDDEAGDRAAWADAVFRP